MAWASLLSPGLVKEPERQIVKDRMDMLAAVNIDTGLFGLESQMLDGAVLDMTPG